MNKKVLIKEFRESLRKYKNRKKNAKEPGLNPNPKPQLVNNQK